jgi:cell division protein FtsW (lipid II flippase)
LAEEIGLAGCALLLLVYGVLFGRGWRAASAAGTPFGMLLAVGLTTALAFQTVLNVAGVTKALPLTGITLPLISHGGSSLVTTLVMIGLLAAVSDRK